MMLNNVFSYIPFLHFRQNISNGSNTRPLRNGPPSTPQESPVAVEMTKVDVPLVSTTCLIPRREQSEAVVSVTKNCEDTKRWV